MPPPAPAPTGKKPLPKWAWLVAGAVGLLVGFLLLRRQGPSETLAGEEGEPEPAETQKKSGGGAGAIPIDEGFLEALGLVPPSDDGFDFSMGEFDSGSQQQEAAPLNADIQPSSPLSPQAQSTGWLLPALSSEGYGTYADTSKGGSFGTPPPTTTSPEPTNPSAGGGSASVKAM